MFQRHRSLVPALPALAYFALALFALSIDGDRARAVETRSDVFAVRDVGVDATAATAAAAREQALATAQREAFKRLLARLTLARDAAKLPRISDSELADLVAGFEVQEEKNSPVRYIATITFHFKMAAVEQLLRDSGVAFAETPSKPIVVLPILRSDDSMMLWEDPNPWRTTWSDLPPANGLVPFLVPIGDIDDISEITAAEAVEGDAGKLQAVARRYGAGSTLVAIATLRRDGGGNVGGIDLALSRQGAGIDQPVADEKSIKADASEELDALLTRAARAIEEEVSERWKEDNLLHFDQVGEAEVAVPIGGLEDWLKVRRRLAQVALISRAELVSFSRNEAKIDIHYLGDPTQLKLALAQRDLLLTEEGGGLVLRLSGTGDAVK